MVEKLKKKKRTVNREIKVSSFSPVVLVVAETKCSRFWATTKVVANDASSSLFPSHSTNTHCTSSIPVICTPTCQDSQLCSLILTTLVATKFVELDLIDLTISKSFILVFSYVN